MTRLISVATPNCLLKLFADCFLHCAKLIKQLSSFNMLMDPRALTASEIVVFSVKADGFVILVRELGKATNWLNLMMHSRLEAF